MLTVVFGPAAVYADQSTSTNYRVLDSVMNSSGYGSSANFTLSGSLSEIGSGTSTSASFGANASFLYFPLASTPSLSVTAGAGAVSLSWTASTGYLGWTAASYEVGQSTTSGGSYSYVSVGSELSSTRTGLSNGTRYYFVVVAKDTFGNTIATSAESSAVPVAAVTSSGSSGSGGGGSSSSVALVETKVLFKGRAYPKAVVTLLRDGESAATVIADSNADFQISLSGFATGNYLFSVYATDSAGRRSPLLSLPATIVQGTTTVVGPFIIAPTASPDKTEVRQGERIIISGASAPGAEVLIAGNSRSIAVNRTKAGSDGAYAYAIETAGFGVGQRSVQSKASRDGAVSPFSSPARFVVGIKNIFSKGRTLPVRGDINKDGKVNVVDFSIISYWYKRPLVGAIKEIEKNNLNGDGMIDMVDFSIMAFYWTG